MAKQFTLSKNERLKSRKQIEQLFNQGKTFTVFPFRVHYILSDVSNGKDQMLQFGVGVSSRNFKKAVDRNRVKRLTREAYRLQKTPVQIKVQEAGRKLNLFLNYTGKELPDFNIVKEKTSVILNKILKLIDEDNSASA